MVDAKAFDKALGLQGELTGYKGCGENRWNSRKNQLEFILTPFCIVRVEPYDSIQSNVRMSWTMDEFFEKGGVTSFVDRVSAALGIHASQMKVVAVYTGSVVVDYEIEPEDDGSDSDAAAQQLRSIETALTALVESSDAGDVFGAPVLSAATNGATVIEDPTYNPAAKPAPTTQIQEEAEEEEEVAAAITVEDGTLKVEVDETTRNSLIGVIVTLVVLVLVCFGCGTALICAYQVSKASKLVTDVQKKHAEQQ